MIYVPVEVVLRTLREIVLLHRKTPEQLVLLNGPNSRQYPSVQEYDSVNIASRF